MDVFFNWVHHLISPQHEHDIQNGILYLKGGDLGVELQDFPSAHCYPISDFFEEPFFETKYVVHLPVK